METVAASLSTADLAEAKHRLLAEIDRRKVENKLQYYSPYVPQSKFHAAGKTHRERLYLGGNRTGKSLCGAAETAMHLTGRYPSWWQGRTFDKPVRVWAAGVTGETTRDVVQVSITTVSDGEIRDCSCFLCQEN